MSQRCVTLCILVIVNCFVNSGHGGIVGGRKWFSIISGTNFREIAGKKMALADKSPMIKEIMEEPSRTVLITRPRRFGKSLGLSMIQSFFTASDDTSYLFKDYLIAGETEFCKKHQNQHPVILVDFSIVKDNSYERSRILLKKMIANSYKQHRYLLSSEEIITDDRAIFEKYVSENTTDAEIYQAIPLLMEFLHMHYKGKNTIVLVDGYDVPLVNAYHEGFYTEMLNDVEVMLRNLYKDNLLLKKGVIFGTLNIAHNSLGPAMRNPKVYTIADQKYSSYFGFSQEEMEQLLEKYSEENMQKKKKKAPKKKKGRQQQQRKKSKKVVDKPNRLKAFEGYYKGYTIGGVTLYNPWSVDMYVDEGRVIASYWIDKDDEGSLEEFKKYLTKYGVMPMIKAEMLMGGTNIRQYFIENFELSDVSKSEDVYWTLLTQLGFLTFNHTGRRDDSKVLCDLKIPNSEVKSYFNEILKTSSYSHEYKVAAYKRFVNILKRNDSSKASQTLDSYLKQAGAFYPGASAVRSVAGVMRGLEKEYGLVREIIDEPDVYIFEMKEPEVVVEKVVVTTAKPKPRLSKPRTRKPKKIKTKKPLNGTTPMPSNGTTTKPKTKKPTTTPTTTTTTTTEPTTTVPTTTTEAPKPKPTIVLIRKVKSQTHASEDSGRAFLKNIYDKTKKAPLELGTKVIAVSLLDQTPHLITFLY